jgi:hypothetical protein
MDERGSVIVYVVALQFDVSKERSGCYGLLMKKFGGILPICVR